MKRYALIIGVLTILVMFFYVGVELLLPITFRNNSVEIRISQGMTFEQAVEALTERGMRRDTHLFYLLGVLTGVDRKLKPGYYVFRSGMTPIEIVQKLLRADIISFKITILPGSTLWSIASIFADHEIMTERYFFELARNEEFLYSLHIEAPSIEGYLFPDTYFFPKGDPPEKIFEVMVDNMRSHLPQDFDERAEALAMTENQILTLASIIEREAVLDSERPVISAVFYNRLKYRIPLQADPTSIYGIKRFKEGVTRNDLLNDTPYNTYKINGLPPGPIASPSMRSILAALNPEEVPYLYFVSKNDGTHHFSETFREHREAIKKYRKKRERKER